MRNPLRVLIVALGIMSLLCVGCEKPKAGGTIRVALSRYDSVPAGVWQGFEFDKTEIAKALEKYPTKFPDPLPEGAQVVMFYAGRVFGIFQKVTGKPFIRLTLDVNTNRDLTDDAPIEVPKVESWKDGIIVKVARSFTSPSPHTEWLPYRIFYEESAGPDGQPREDLSVAPNYDYKGEFRLGERDYGVGLHDGDMGGRFIREKQVNVNLRVGLKEDLDKPGAAPWHRLFELIPIGGSLYEVKAIAEDGSWVEFAASGLPTTALGTRAPDIAMTDTAGKTFRISDYRGKVLVLDFWYVWCKPCIAKFPAIKKMIESYFGKPLAAVGVNIDIPERVEQAKKVIADNQLSWRQVVEGKGEFLPVYQVYGRLPERPMSFPIYVAIDERGITRYATNDFEKMGRFLDAHFNNPKGTESMLFIPCQDKYALPSEPRPTIQADFKSQKVLDLVHSGQLKIPDNLPKDARVGLLPNGTALVAYSGPAADKVHLVVDTNHDFDLTKEQGYDIPIMNGPAPDVTKMVEVNIQVPWASGGIAFFDMPSYARSDPVGGPPEVYGLGHITRFEGAFFVGKSQYALEFADTNGDRLMTDEDTGAPGFLKLKIKKGETWTEVHEGTSRIPIGRSLYQLRHVSDDGYLVELEKEK